MKKKLLCYILVLAMLVTTVTFSNDTRKANAAETTKELETGESETQVPEGYTGIYDVADLYAVNNDLTGKYILMNDIDLTLPTADGGDYNYLTNGWDPIGSGGIYGSNIFDGVFDGNKHSITGMNICVSKKPSGVENTTYLGLFSKIGPNGVVKKLTLKKISIQSKVCIRPGARLDGTDYIGAIAAYNEGSITECSVEGNIQNKYEENVQYSLPAHQHYDMHKYIIAGGITGYNEGVVNNCRNDASVSSMIQVSGAYNYRMRSNGQYDYVSVYYNVITGGVVGQNDQNTDDKRTGLVTRCLNTGDIYTELNCSSDGNYYQGHAMAGGCVGKNDSAKITDCYSTEGKISGKSDGVKEKMDPGVNRVYVGGIGGYDRYGKIESCYTNANVSASCYVSQSESYQYRHKTYVYPIVFTEKTSSDIKNCYYLAGLAADQTGAKSLTETQMKISSNYQGFDFDKIWVTLDKRGYDFPQLRENLYREEIAVDSIEFLQKPAKTNYYVDDSIDVTGGKLQVYLVDNTYKKVDITSDMVSGYDMKKTGDQTVTVTYRGKTLDYVIHVNKQPAISQMTVISQPDKKEFVRGTFFDFTGCKVQILYANGENEIVDVTADMTTGGDITSSGTQNITYKKYGNSVTFQVKVVPVKPTGITVTKLPDRIKYVIGEEFDPKGLEVQACNNDGSMRVITDYTLSGYKAEEGTQTITVTHYDYTTTFEVIVADVVPERIAVVEQPEKTEYYTGQTLDTEGMVVKAYYKNGYAREVSDYTVGKLPEISGQGSVKISYSGLETSVFVTMKIRKMDAIEITQKPAKIKYVVGDSVDLTGMVVMGQYNDGSKEEITDYTIIPVSTETAGKKELTLLYKGMDVSLEITVVDPVMTGIRVDMPDKIEYLEGEAFDSTGLKVYKCYENNKEVELANTEYEITGYTGKVGTDIITVSYQEYCYKFYVTIRSEAEPTVEPTAVPEEKPNVTWCELSKLPDKTEFVQGSFFDFSGCTAIYGYSNGKTVTVNITADMTIGGDINRCGAQTITYIRDGREVSFNVTVIPRRISQILVSELPQQTVYELGESFNKKGMIVQAVYNDESRKIIESDDYEVIGFSSAICGVQTVRINYQNYECTLTVEVVDSVPSYISVWKQPDKVTYLKNESFDSSGLVIKAFYKNNFSKEIKGYTISDLPDATGEGNVVVTYRGVSTKIPVWVLEPSAVSLELVKKPAKLSYRKGEQLDLDGIFVNVVYNDDSRINLMPSDMTMVPVSLDTPGSKQITLLYKGMEVSFDVTVENPKMTGIRVKQPKKLKYETGEEFDRDGLRVYACYDDNSEKEIAEAQYTVTGFTGKKGTDIITVSYMNYQYKFYTVMSDSSSDITPLPSQSPWEESLVEDITLISMPTKTEFVCGTSFDFSGCKVKIRYKDGQTLVEDVTDRHTIGGDINTEGRQTITFLRDGASVSFEVTVIPVVVTGIDIVTLPDRTRYQLGEEFDPDGMVVQASRSDGSKIQITNYAIQGFEKKVGMQAVTISYQGFEKVISVTVVDEAPESISIWSLPTKMSYYTGQKFNPSGMIVRAHYKEGYSISVEPDSTWPVLKESGQNKVKVSYRGKETEITVTAVQPKTISVELIHKPDKLIYNIDEKVDLKGLAVVAKRNDGIVVDAGDYTMVPVSTEESGKKTVTLLYGEGMAVSFEIVVVEPLISGIHVKKPDKLHYTLGEKFDSSGMEVTVDYSDNTSRKIKNYSITGYTGDLGSNVITVSYKGFEYSFYVSVENTPVSTPVSSATQPGDTEKTGNMPDSISGESDQQKKLLNGLQVGEVVTIGNLRYIKISDKKISVAGLTDVAVGKRKVAIPAKLTIGEKEYTVSRIENNAFKGTKLVKITIGKNVTQIGKKAFSDCKKLKIMCFKGKLKKVYKKAFSGCRNRIKVRCSKNKWKKTNVRLLKKSGYKKFK